MIPNGPFCASRLAASMCRRNRRTTRPSDCPNTSMRRSFSHCDNSTEHNLMTNEGAALGRLLFYDTQLSRNNTVSCAACHDQRMGFSDPKHSAWVLKEAAPDAIRWAWQIYDTRISIMPGHDSSGMSERRLWKLRCSCRFRPPSRWAWNWAPRKPSSRSCRITRRSSPPCLARPK